MEGLALRLQHPSPLALSLDFLLFSCFFLCKLLNESNEKKCFAGVWHLHLKKIVIGDGYMESVELPKYDCSKNNN